MYVLKLFVILYLLVSIQIEAGRKILSGELADSTKHAPFIVRITVYKEKIDPTKGGQVGNCAGSYIRPIWVLSAAHCIKNSFPIKNHKPKFEIILCMGSIVASPFDCPEPNKRFGIEIYPHTEGDPAFKAHDILLIKVSKPWVLGPGIQIAKLSTTKVDKNTYNNKKCLITGWGITGLGLDDNRSALKKATVTIIVGNNKKCKIENERQICAVADSGITCRGDSGGPLICDGKVIAALRGGFGPCNSTEDKTSFFNLLSEYEDWIMSIAGADGGSSTVPNNFCLFIVPAILFYNFE